MGVLTLAEFRTELISTLGNNFSDTDRAEIFINSGYYDLVGSVDFEELNQEDTAPTADGVATVAIPTGGYHVKLVKDETNDRILEWSPKTELLRRNSTVEGEPLIWTRIGGNIRLNPTPDATYNLYILSKRSPDRLTADSDVSELPEIWDPAILMLSAHHAFMALGQEQRSAAWLARAITFIQSRITETDFNATEPGLAPSVGLDRLQARLQNMGAQ